MSWPAFEMALPMHRASSKSCTSLSANRMGTCTDARSERSVAHKAGLAQSELH